MSDNTNDFYKLALDNISDQIVVTDKSGTIIYVNNAIIKTTGFTKQEALNTKAGKLWGNLMPKEFYEKMWDQIAIKKQVFIGEITNRRKDGTIYTAQISISPMLNRDLEVVNFVGIERDITHEKEVDKMKTEFISLASHQLRTPLSAIKWNLEMILSGENGTLPGSLSKSLTDIDNANERMIDLINSLLNISRIESGRIIINPKPTDLIELVNAVINELKPKLVEKEMTCDMETEGTTRLLNVDSNLIRHVFINLISNSIKYTNIKGKITVHIKFEDDGVLFIISDNGVGIPQNQQDKIFTKFFRADNVVRDIPEGTGLGLYLIKMIINACQGEIWFDSKQNEGTNFYFKLPNNPSSNQGEVNLS